MLVPPRGRIPDTYLRAAASVSALFVTGWGENASTDSLYGMMLNVSPISSPPRTCRTADRLFAARRSRWDPINLVRFYGSRPYGQYQSLHIIQ